MSIVGNNIETRPALNILIKKYTQNAVHKRVNLKIGLQKLYLVPLAGRHSVHPLPDNCCTGKKNKKAIKKYKQAKINRKKINQNFSPKIMQLFKKMVNITKKGNFFYKL